MPAPFPRTATAALIALVLQACGTAPPRQSSLEGYAFPLPQDEIPAVVREAAHPAHMFSYELPASQFQRLETESVGGAGQQYWTDPRIARWQRDTVAQRIGVPADAVRDWRPCERQLLLALPYSH